MIRITKEIISAAKFVNLPDFLEKNGVQLKKNGKTSFTLVNHNSLVISLSNKGFWMFYWNSRNTQGDAIKFIMDYYNINFKQAVAVLTAQNIYIFDYFNKKEQDIIQQKSSSINLELTENMKRVFAYLIKSRHIDAKLVQSLVKESLLFQDIRGNAVFPFYNCDGNIVGAELHGTHTTIRFKGIQPGSQFGYGFSITKGAPGVLFCFESSIDLLSYMTLNNDLSNA